MRTSRDEIPGVKKQGHRIWFVNAARGMGFRVKDELSDNHIVARVNHGRWIADCPYCGGAELADATEPDFGWLRRGNPGGNKENIGDGLVMPIDFPAQIRGIEKALSARPELNRNWEPHETVGDLHKENRDHGLPNEAAIEIRG